MKIIAIICNLVLVGFTCFVIATDGFPREATHVVRALLVLLIPILSLLVISWSSVGTAMKIAAVICNAVLIGFVFWALVEQYPHPKESGFIAYVVLLMLTPILNVAALLRSGARK